MKLNRFEVDRLEQECIEILPLSSCIGGWPAIISTAKTCCEHTAAVVKWVVHTFGNWKIAGSNLSWENFFFFLQYKVRDTGRGTQRPFLDGCAQRTGA